jgi:hypothetical protein
MRFRIGKSYLRFYQIKKEKKGGKEGKKRRRGREKERMEGFRW